MKLKNAPKLEPGHLYLVKRDWDRDEQYLLVYPLYDMNEKVIGWKRQSPLTTVACFDDDIIIGSVERIEERRHMQESMGDNLSKQLAAEDLADHCEHLPCETCEELTCPYMDKKC